MVSVTVCAQIGVRGKPGSAGVLRARRCEDTRERWIHHHRLPLSGGHQKREGRDRTRGRRGHLECFVREESFGFWHLRRRFGSCILGNALTVPNRFPRVQGPRKVPTPESESESESRSSQDTSLLQGARYHKHVSFHTAAKPGPERRDRLWPLGVSVSLCVRSFKCDHPGCSKAYKRLQIPLSIVSSEFARPEES